MSHANESGVTTERLPKAAEQQLVSRCLTGVGALSFFFFIDTTDRTKDIKCLELSKLGISGSKLHKIPFTVVYNNDPKMRNIRTLLVCTNTKTDFRKQPLNDVT